MEFASIGRSIFSVEPNRYSVARNVLDDMMGGNDDRIAEIFEGDESDPRGPVGREAAFVFGADEDDGLPDSFVNAQACL